MPNNQLPILDLHCDLLSYLSRLDGADYTNADDIGCALPFLKEGHVKLQVLAVFSPTRDDSVDYALGQIPEFEMLMKEAPFSAATSVNKMETILDNEKIGLVVAIENASGLAKEEEPLDKAFERLDHFIDKTGRIIYISLTHHDENRFGGGNYATAGLKTDGKELLKYMAGKGIAVDLSHTSDALAYDILNYTDQHSLDVPIIASHSNFRPLCDHVRNLTDEMTQEIIKRKGLIGMNFLRDYVDKDNPDALIEHILYGIEQGASDALCFGADYFYVKAVDAPDRLPFYFPEHEDASCYPNILNQLRDRGLSEDFLEGIAYKNVMNFLARAWK